VDKGAACEEAPQADGRQAREGEVQRELAGPEDVLREEFAPLFNLNVQTREDTSAPI